MQAIERLRRLDGPADATLRTFFREHPRMGQADRAFVAEGGFAFLRRMRFPFTTYRGDDRRPYFYWSLTGLEPIFQAFRGTHWMREPCRTCERRAAAPELPEVRRPRNDVRDQGVLQRAVAAERRQHEADQGGRGRDLSALRTPVAPGHRAGGNAVL